MRAGHAGWCSAHLRHFGKTIIADRMGLPESDPNVELLWLQLYSEMIESVDA